MPKKSTSDRQLMQNIINNADVQTSIQLLLDKKQAYIHRLINQVDPHHHMEVEDLIQYGNEIILQHINVMKANHTNPEKASLYFNHNLKYQFTKLAEKHQQISIIPISNHALERSIGINQYLADQYTLDPMDRQELQHLLGRALNDATITKLEFDIIVYLYGTRNDDPHTIKATAEYMSDVELTDYTEQRIRQISKRAIKKLKRYDHQHDDELYDYLQHRNYVPTKTID